MSEERIDIVIPARGGSVGISRKNIALVGGRPLIAWSIISALGAGFLRRVVVSTDDQEIGAVATEHGAEVPYLRPAELAEDTSHPVLSVLYHLDWCEKHGEQLPRGVFMLLPTSIFRTGMDLANMVHLFESERSCSSVVAVCRDSSVVRASRTVNRDGFLSEIAEVTSTAGHLRRQDAGEFYRINGCAYLASPTQLRRNKSYINVPSAVPYVMNSFSAVDIDTQQDLAIAEHLSPVLMAAIENNSSFVRAEGAGETNHVPVPAPF